MKPLKYFKSLFTLARRHRGKLILSNVCSILSGVLSLVPFILVAQLANIMTQETPTQAERIYPVILLTLGVIALRYALMTLGKITSHIAAFVTMYDLQIALAQKIGTLPLGEISARGSAILKKTILQDTDSVHTIIGHYIDDFLSGLIVPVLTLGLFFYLDWRLAIAAVAVLPLLYLSYRASFKNYEKESADYFQADDHLQESITEYVSGISVIKTFNRDVSQKLQDAVIAQITHMGGWVRKTMTGWSSFNILTDASLVVILPVGLWMAVQGYITPETLLAFLLLGIGYLQPLVRLSIQLGFLNYASKGIERIEALMSAPPLMSSAHPRIPANNDISFRNVSFSYEGKTALQDVSLDIPAGGVCAIVGPSGAGKTTLVKLIGRFWDVAEGSISIGGVDIRDIAEEELYKRVSFVFQDVFLFNGTVTENLRLARPDAGAEDIIAAAKAAQAHDFIMRLPQGYETQVGEKGCLLSGGQKQRLSIARALLRNTPILILDEATAYADAINEAEIQKALGTLMKDRTIIMIAHRLSKIVQADKIVVLERGKMVAEDHHGRLLNTCPLYRSLWADYTQVDRWKFEKAQLAGAA